MMGDGARITFGCFYRTLPMLAAERLGFYRRHDLEVDYQRVASSTQQFAFLRDGGYDVVQTSPDNVANYRYNRGNPLGERMDVQGFMGMDHGLYLVLVARPEIRSAGELRGRTVAVDARESGFAYVLYEILARAGLQRGEDYSVVPVGGVSQRFDRLLAGDPSFDATLLSGGFETRAANAGYQLFGSAHDIADPYVGAWGAATLDWLRERADDATALVGAYREATEWCFAPDNRRECLELLMEAAGTPPELAEQLYEIQIRDRVGNVPDAGIVADGVRNVLALRARFGGFEEEPDLDAMLTDGELYDLRFLSGTGSAGQV
jgi:ABC-type nitrate/sulfonate/bicarbonate transport system substrate-binding protein